MQAPVALNKPSPSPLPAEGEATIRTQQVPSARPSELTFGLHYLRLTIRAVSLSRVQCYLPRQPHRTNTVAAPLWGALSTVHSAVVTTDSHL
jgi:hypothetical protein